MRLFRWLSSRTADPAPKLTLDTAMVSDAGGREENQDAARWWVDGGTGIWVVCDGLGGHPGSASAASLAADSVVTAFRSRPDASRRGVEAWVRAGHETVLQGRRSGDLDSMRTTIAVLAAHRGRVAWGHVGDTRVYRFYGSASPERTTDHSVPEMLLADGQIKAEEIRHHPDRNVVLRALGQDEVLKVSVDAGAQLGAGDAFLLCTDGWWEDVLEDEMAEDLRACDSAPSWLDRMARRIRARIKPGHDNFTALAVRVR